MPKPKNATQITNVVSILNQLKSILKDDEISHDELSVALQLLEECKKISSDKIQSIKHAEATKESAIIDIRKKLQLAGLSIDELSGSNENIRPKRVSSSPEGNNKRAKYLIVQDGVSFSWSGVGAMPSVFKIAIAKGAKLKDFLIK